MLSRPSCSNAWPSADNNQTEMISNPNPKGFRIPSDTGLILPACFGIMIKLTRMWWNWQTRWI